MGRANPIGAIWSGALLLRHLGEETAAARIEAAIDAVAAEGEFLTGELGGKASTAEVGQAIAREVSASGRHSGGIKPDPASAGSSQG
jgi:isocitrate/isopropylmalate dehydrogenase